jgi:hypothetical protein
MLREVGRRPPSTSTSGTRCDDVDRPDYLHFDLDPVKGTPFERVVETALLVRDTLYRGAARLGRWRGANPRGARGAGDVSLGSVEGELPKGRSIASTVPEQGKRIGRLGRVEVQEGVVAARRHARHVVTALAFRAVAYP